MKRQIIGQHHWVNVKHLQSYLNERVFMFNNRQAEDLFKLVTVALVCFPRKTRHGSPSLKASAYLGLGHRRRLQHSLYGRVECVALDRSLLN